MLAHAPRISDSFLRYEHHRNRSSLCLFARRQSQFPIVIRTTACSLSRYLPRLPVPPPKSPTRIYFRPYLSGGVGIPRASTRRALKVCSRLCHQSFFQSADGHADVAGPPLSLHLFAHIFTNLHCPRAPPPLTPALGLAPSRAALSASEATRQS